MKSRKLWIYRHTPNYDHRILAHLAEDLMHQELVKIVLNYTME